jgi:3-hydroxyisobutyrate dehydrogenase
MSEDKPDSPADQTIAWIGVGNLATPIVARLIAAGIRPTLYDIRADATAPFAGKVEIAASLDEAVAGSDLTFSTIPSHDALHAVAAAVSARGKAGAVWCDMSTVSPQASEDAAALLEGTGIAHLRAPVSGSVGQAEQGVLTVIASGPEDAYQRCLPVFKHFSTQRFHVGHGEEARYMKLLINNMVGSLAAMLAESLAMGTKAGLDWTTMLDVVSASAIASPLLKYKAELLKKRDFSPAFTTDLMIKDMALFEDAASALGCSAPLAGETLALLKDYAAAGGAEEDYYGLVKLFEERAGV